ncbi:MAG: phosphodiester glycosidase family protein, partial [Clostridia bacterium]
GEVLMLIVDGRAPGYSIGCTLGDCADIMERYGAVQACNLDGGSSSIMYYNGREISRPSAANKVKGRAIPNGFMVFKK